jgi:hypothetical protein
MLSKDYRRVNYEPQHATKNFRMQTMRFSYKIGCHLFKVDTCYIYAYIFLQHVRNHWTASVI